MARFITIPVFTNWLAGSWPISSRVSCPSCCQLELASSIWDPNMTRVLTISIIHVHVSTNYIPIRREGNRISQRFTLEWMVKCNWYILQCSNSYVPKASRETKTTIHSKSWIGWEELQRRNDDGEYLVITFHMQNVLQHLGYKHFMWRFNTFVV